MKRIVLFFAVLLMFAAAPAAAQSRSVDLIGYASWVDLSGDATLEDADGLDDLDVDFEGDMGYGIGINVFLGNRLSAEFAGSVVNVEVNAANGAVSPFLAGDLEMIPLTGTLQFHFAPNSRIDPYIGAGVAYVLFDEVEGGEDLENVDIDAIEFEDDYGFVANAGIDIGLTDMIALNADAKYVPVESSARARFASGFGQFADIEVNPMILSAGLRLRF